MSWSAAQRDAVREYLGEAQPNNPAILISNIEEFMPPNIRRGFEKLFDRISPHGVDEVSGEWWVVWSGEHQQWWGPHSRGYTSHLRHAGVYTRQRAEEIAGAPAIGRRPNEAMSFAAAIERAESSPGATVGE